MESRRCGLRQYGPLRGAWRRVTSVINNCNHSVSLLAIDPVRPTGLRPPTIVIARWQWAWTLGGSRGMDNRATHVRVP